MTIPWQHQACLVPLWIVSEHGRWTCLSKICLCTSFIWGTFKIPISCLSFIEVLYTLKCFQKRFRILLLFSHKHLPFKCLFCLMFGIFSHLFSSVKSLSFRNSFIFWSVYYDQGRATELGAWPRGRIHEESVPLGWGKSSCILGLNEDDLFNRV